MIKLNVSAANIAVEEKETLTEGRVGLLCRFSFTGEWDGLAKTAVFDGADSRDVILTEDTVAVPAECLAAEGYSLSVGVYGKNAAGDIVIPTVYATVGKIQRSAYPSGRETAPPTLDVVAQIQQAAANAEAMARAVREDAELGKFKGEKGDKGDAGEKGGTGPAGEAGGWYTPAITQPDENTMRVSFSPSKEGMPQVQPADITLPAGSGSGGSGADGGYYTPEVTQTSENTMQVAFSPSKTSMPAVSGTEITLPAGQKGDKGDTGATGADGKSAYAYAVEGGYTGTEEEFAAKLAAEMPDAPANPYPLEFVDPDTGETLASYDGSAPVAVEMPGGGGGERKLSLLADVDFTDNTASRFDYTDLGGISEIYIVGGEIKSALDNAASNFTLTINDIAVASSSVLSIQKSSGTDTWNFYNIFKYNGAFWESFRSPTHGGASTTGHINDYSGPNSVVLDVGEADKITLYVPNPSYKPVAGWMKIWVR